MAGPAATTLTNQKDRYTGPVHSSGWLFCGRPAWLTTVEHVAETPATKRGRIPVPAKNAGLLGSFGVGEVEDCLPQLGQLSACAVNRDPVLVLDGDEEVTLRLRLR